MKTLLMTILSASVLLLTGCDSGALGFSLPEGDAVAGKVVYTTMQCHSCHQMDGIEQLPTADDNAISVKLGGKVSTMKTYGQLVTSVINPSHRIARGYEPQNTDSEGASMMSSYNDVMTVTQLVDLVSFLESQYELLPYERTRY